MSQELHPDFELSIASPSDIDEVFDVMERAYANDEIWRPMVKNCKSEDVRLWIMEHLGPRWIFSDIEIYKITEKSTGKIVAWTALQFPWTIKALDDQMKGVVMNVDTPALLDTMDEVAASELIKSITCAYSHGYEPENDFHRKGTMVHPDFQKRGFGTVLTQHCNDIADKAGKRTFLPARPTSHPMFLKMGFKDLGIYDSHVERWDEVAERGKTFAMMREPGSS